MSVTIHNPRQDRLDETLLQFDSYSPDQHVEFMQSLDYEAAHQLAADGFINCIVTKMTSGRYRLRFTGSEHLTPKGRQRIFEITGQI